MDSPQNVRVAVNGDGTALVELNRPEKRNAFSQTMICELVAALDSLDNNPEVRCIVIAGSPGGSFCGKHPPPPISVSQRFSCSV